VITESERRIVASNLRSIAAFAEASGAAPLDPARLRMIADKLSADHEPTAFVVVPRETLAAVVDYSYPSEEADYVREGEPEGHVFEHLAVLNDCLKAYGPGR